MRIYAMTLSLAALALLGACSRGADSRADDALKTDLALAAQTQPYQAQQFTSPTHTALIFALEPVFAWLTSFIILGERLGIRPALGALLILTGVLISELRGAVAEPRAYAT